MGGRLALSYACNCPEKVYALILESSSPGLTENEAKAGRVQSDNNLAEQIEQKGVRHFINFWYNQPLFSTLKSVLGDRITAFFEERYKNNKAGLINSLKGFGAGVMPNLRDELQRINYPVLLAAGAKDKKYVEINSDMQSLISNSVFNIIDSAGHNIHLEKPVEFVSLLNNFLGNICQ